MAKEEEESASRVNNLLRRRRGTRASFSKHYVKQRRCAERALDSYKKKENNSRAKRLKRSCKQNPYTSSIDHFPSLLYTFLLLCILQMAGNGRSGKPRASPSVYRRTLANTQTLLAEGNVRWKRERERRSSFLLLIDLVPRVVIIVPGRGKIGSERPGIHRPGLAIWVFHRSNGNVFAGRIEAPIHQADTPSLGLLFILCIQPNRLVHQKENEN